MASRYRFIWNRFSRLGSRLVQSTISLKNIPQYKFTKPTIISFTLFTWLGFKDKISAEDELITTIKHCILFIQREDYEKAEQLLHVALRQAQQMQNQLGITYIYDVMANLALQREHLDKAKKLFIAITQRIMADGAQEDDFRVVHLSAKLARVSHLQKEYEIAQIGYEWCLEKLKQAVQYDPSDNNRMLLALTEDWYGRLFVDCNRCEDGLKLMVSSYNRMEDIPNVDKEDLVIQLNDIGTVYDRLDKTDESINYFMKALEMGKTIEMKNLGIMYVNLGKVYIKKQMIDTARKYCGHAWKIAVNTKNDVIKDEAASCLKEIKNMT